MSRPLKDRLLRTGLAASAVLSGSLVVIILLFLVRESWPALENGQILRFFRDRHWQPASRNDPQFSLWPMLAASFLITAVAALLALPLGVGCAVFRRFYLGERTGRMLDRGLELLTGIPSVVFGFWGLTTLVPLINRIQPPGHSLLAAGIVLAIMILPTVALTSAGALRSVPRDLLQGAAALGMGRPATVLKIALPWARKGILGGGILAVTRALGETLAVVMVCGNIPRMPGSLFDPVRPVTATIALEMGYAAPGHRALLYAAGLMLVVITGLLFFVRKPVRGKENAS